MTVKEILFATNEDDTTRFLAVEEDVRIVQVSVFDLSVSVNLTYQDCVSNDYLSLRLVLQNPISV